MLNVNFEKCPYSSISVLRKCQYLLYKTAYVEPLPESIMLNLFILYKREKNSHNISIMLRGAILIDAVT